MLAIACHVRTLILRCNGLWLFHIAAFNAITVFELPIQKIKDISLSSHATLVFNFYFSHFRAGLSYFSSFSLSGQKVSEMLLASHEMIFNESN